MQIYKTTEKVKGHSLNKQQPSLSENSRKLSGLRMETNYGTVPKALVNRQTGREEALMMKNIHQTVDSLLWLKSKMDTVKERIPKLETRSIKTADVILSLNCPELSTW